jgi:hypothetical protein
LAVFIDGCTGNMSAVTVAGNGFFTGMGDPALDAVSVNPWFVRAFDVANCIFYDNFVFDYDRGASVEASFSDIGTGQTTGVQNISEDPLFASGPLGDHYLGRIASGQGADSPCVDAGNGSAADIGLDTYTTCTLETPDTGTVDMGYHYPRPGVLRERTIYLTHGTDTTVSYQPYPGNTYDLIRGLLSNITEWGGAIDLGPVDCIEEDDTTGSIIDAIPPDLPPPGECYFYLLRDDTAPGPYGFSSGGEERQPQSGDCL